MKKFVFAILAIAMACALFFAGWYFGRKSCAKLASDVLKAQMFANAYTQLAENHVVIEELGSNRIEDAKNMLYLNEDSNIFALDNLLQSPNSDISLADLKMLLKIHEGTRTQSGSVSETSNKLLARVAKYRTEDPWKYTGKMPHSTNAEIESRLSSILKQASQNQK